MTVRLLGRPGRKPTWDQLAARLRAVAAERFTAAGIVVSDDPAGPWVSWHDGPGVTTVLDALGDTPGWEWAATAPGPVAPLPPEDAPPDTAWVRRTYSDAALAVALVRFVASKGRHFTTADERGRQHFGTLLDVDDPAASGYPIVDAVAELLLTTPDPGPADLGARPPAARVDELSAKLVRLGYDNLWAVAFSAVR